MFITTIDMARIIYIYKILAMSIVVMNIVQQLSINVELQVQHLSRPDSIEYCGTFLWKSSESELETLVFQKQTTYKNMTYLITICRNQSS